MNREVWSGVRNAEANMAFMAALSFAELVFISPGTCPFQDIPLSPLVEQGMVSQGWL